MGVKGIVATVQQLLVARFLLLALGVVNATAVLAAAPDPAVAVRAYPTAQEAVNNLVEALRAGSSEALLALFGPSSQKLLSSGDQYADAAERKRFLDAYQQHHDLVAAAPDRLVLQVGEDNWPLPIPIVQADGRWHFDAAAGVEEIVKRRIGRNEIAAIRTSLAYVDAQKAFFAVSSSEGQGHYAQRLVSSSGKSDGLYWPAAEGRPDSPLEPLVAQAREEGYPVDVRAGQRRPYHGYFFRILTGQGTSTPDGTRNYIHDGRMTEGFALVAWPASYGASGIMSFIVDQDGIVFQKDLGARTEVIASTMKLYDPDLTWARVDIVK